MTSKPTTQEIIERLEAVDQEAASMIRHLLRTDEERKAEIERLNEWKRKQAEDIMTLGAQVGAAEARLAEAGKLLADSLKEFAPVSLKNHRSRVRDFLTGERK